MAAPRLTVSILTRDSEPRLERLLAEVAQFADEVLVGVDAASVDRSLEIATAQADVVYRFQHAGQLSPARMLPFAHASGDWILSLDDDESMEASFDALLPTLLADPRPTHYWFPRKWIASLDPCEYVHAMPWFPDWQLRLFRNDRSLVWKPNRPHTGYYVQGPGYLEARSAILHFEPVMCSVEARREKVERYRQAGGVESGQRVFDSIAGATRRPATRRDAAPVRPRREACVTHHDVQNVTATDLPPWRSAITDVKLPAICSAGEPLIAEVTARNTGVLAWTPPGTRWPVLLLGAHILRDDGSAVLWDGPRTAMPRFVAPGDSVTFLFPMQAPELPGRYVVEWDLVSDGECWFAACGSIVQRAPLEVLNAAPTAS